MNSRRTFLKLLSIAGFTLPEVLIAKPAAKNIIMTVNGPIDAKNIGYTLPHEHILVDFIGADQVKPARYNKTDVLKKVTPFLKRAKQNGFDTLVECTPNYLGRDPELMQTISRQLGINILTNTGYYGARENKFIPEHAFDESAQKLAERWIHEWKNGLDGTRIKPGFIKIGVDRGSLSEFHRKLVRAAAITHKNTGLTIAAHTGPAVGAYEEIEILKEEGVKPDALIWVHAQNEKDMANFVKIAKSGTWVSLDGVKDNQIDDYVARLVHLKESQQLRRVLVSHDAGWYRPGEPNGGDFRDYSAIPDLLIPALKKVNFSQKEIDQIFINNPSEAFTISKKLL